MRPLLIISAVLLAAALPAAALASRAPSRDERAQLRQAVKSSELVPRAVRRGHFELSKPRISTEGPWARAAIVPTGAYSDPFDPSRGLFKHGRKGWRLVTVGTSGIGCSKPRLPRAVRKDLKLRCP
ncbi:MAG: hypothetical protein QOD71_1132 [Thermoleophilaceae bacterium]|jgi:hypothetical protein|nr:hypothetical protein [Thermoleophilaceae bacterium]